MKFTFVFAFAFVILLSMYAIAAPVAPVGMSVAQAVLKRQNGPVLPLPAQGETLLAFLDRLLSKLPLLGHLMEGLGYVRP
ncbi:hypothetical protein BX070DRAFT_224097, partial [Coemansia spiralis]